jgi:hypothetical protein
MFLVRFLLGVTLLIVGIFGVALGEADDSPGAGGIGLLIAVSGTYLIVNSLIKFRKKSKK